MNTPDFHNHGPNRPACSPEKHAVVMNGLPPDKDGKREPFADGWRRALTYTRQTPEGFVCVCCQILLVALTDPRAATKEKYHPCGACGVSYGDCKEGSRRFWVYCCTDCSHQSNAAFHSPPPPVLTKKRAKTAVPGTTARLDVEGTAEPRTTLVGDAKIGERCCFGPSSLTNLRLRDNETGKETSLRPSTGQPGPDISYCSLCRKARYGREECPTCVLASSIPKREKLTEALVTRLAGFNREVAYRLGFETFVDEARAIQALEKTSGGTE